MKKTGLYFQSCHSPLLDPFFPIHLKIFEKDTITGGFNFVKDSVESGQAFETALVLSVKPWDFLSFETGLGGIIGDHEYVKYRERWEKILPDAKIWPFNKFTSMAWYVQAEATIFEHMKVSPEIGQYIYGPFLGFGRYLYWGFNTIVDF